MNTKSLLNKLGKRFPKKYAKMNHDFVGLMTGKLPEEIHKIVLCLDCDWEIFDKIKEENLAKGKDLKDEEEEENKKKVVNFTQTEKKITKINSETKPNIQTIGKSNRKSMAFFNTPLSKNAENTGFKFLLGRENYFKGKDIRDQRYIKKQKTISIK